MYGLLLEVLQKYIIEKYGTEIWFKIVRLQHLNSKYRLTNGKDKNSTPNQQNFIHHHMYSEVLLPGLVCAFSEVVDLSDSEAWSLFGNYFVNYCYNNGYANVLKALGRDLRDFLNGLDDLHEYLRFTYPQIRPPSFSVIKEDAKSLTLLYRSQRSGYQNYVAGQILKVANLIYNKEIKVEMGSKHIEDGRWCFEIIVCFNNSEYECLQRQISMTLNKGLSSTQLLLSNFKLINSSLLLDLFPFAIIFCEDLMIKAYGSSLSKLFNQQILNFSLNELFRARRPAIPLSWHAFSEFPEGCGLKEGRCIPKENTTITDVRLTTIY